MPSLYMIGIRVTAGKVSFHWDVFWVPVVFKNGSFVKKRITNILWSIF